MSEFLEGVEFTFKGTQIHHEKNSIECGEDIVDICLGQYGDGCGGGRIFILFASHIKAYDLESQRFISLPFVFEKAEGIQKTKCELFVRFKDKESVFDLSKMHVKP